MPFDRLIVGQILNGPNPAAAVRRRKHVVKKAKTAVLDGDEAKKLIDGHRCPMAAGLRHHAPRAFLVEWQFLRMAALSICMRRAFAGTAFSGHFPRRPRNGGPYPPYSRITPGPQVGFEHRQQSPLAARPVQGARRGPMESGKCLRL